MLDTLLCIGLILMAIAFSFEITETLKGKICCILVILIFCFAFLNIVEMEYNQNQENWNNGYCECGTHWELKGVSNYRYLKTKYYVCPNCYEEIEINY